MVLKLITANTRACLLRVFFFFSFLCRLLLKAKYLLKKLAHPLRRSLRRVQQHGGGDIRLERRSLDDYYY